MNSYLLDTSIIIDFLKGDKTGVEKLKKLEGNIFSSYICLAEMYEGINREPGRKSEGKILGYFKSLTGVLGIDEETASIFGELRAEMKQKGEMIEDMDLFIAATCIANNLYLVTGNKKHFSKVRGLKLWEEL